MIVGLGSSAVDGVDALQRYLTEDAVGVVTKMAVLRGGERRTLTVIPAELRT